MKAAGWARNLDSETNLPLEGGVCECEWVGLDGGRGVCVCLP